MSYDPQKHHRRSIRLPGYDYAQPGAYFVTICTKDRRSLFGVIANQAVLLSPIGHIVEQCWLALPNHFPHLSLDAFVIMPDHLHGILVLSGNTVSAQPMPHEPPRGTQPNSLSAIIQNFKSVATRRVNQARHTPGATLWHRNYYERIARDSDALFFIRRYIRNNPARTQRSRHK